MRVEIYTWGYQGRQVAALEEIVRREEIDLVVDVRGNPYSRRPGWRKEQLEEVFDDRYRWIGWLGNENYRDGGPPRLRDPHRGMEELVGVIDGGARRVLLLCYERDWLKCHRRMVVEMAQERLSDVQVRHLE